MGTTARGTSMRVPCPCDISGGHHQACASTAGIVRPPPGARTMLAAASCLCVSFGRPVNMVCARARVGGHMVDDVLRRVRAVMAADVRLGRQLARQVRPV